MKNGKLATRVPAYLPKLAVTAFVCWGLGTNTYFDSTDVSPAVLWHVQPSVAASPVETGAGAALKVLSAKDSRFYREIFAAQDQSDWTEADRSIAKLSDKRLLGHVLANRYQRQPAASAADLQAWLVEYADLPQANELYGRAVSLAEKGTPITPPATANMWSGSDGYVTSFGFRNIAGDRKASPGARRFAAKLSQSLRQGKPVAAEKLLEAEQRHHSLTSDEVGSAQGLIASSYFYKGQITYARHMANEGAKRQNPLALWIAGLTAWKQNDAAAAGKAFTLLAAQSDLTGWDRAAAGFWAWRALKRSGDAKNSRYWLERAARQPHSFYGFMAAHLLGHDNDWSWELPKIEEQQIANLARQKAGGRALALLQVGQHELAESELRHINPQGRRDLQDAMLALASAERMPSLALQIGGVATRANGEPYEAALYPLPPWEPADGFTVDRALLFALMRHESQFDPFAVSDRGACGLMQLLPATAKLMTYGDGMKVSVHDCSGSLLDPSVNMALGQKYVEHLAEQPLIGDNLLLLLAAYNSGPNKLAQWLHEDNNKPRKRTVSHRRAFEREDPLLFLESLPLRQTHDYVVQVLIHYWFYRARLGESETSLTELAHGQWPRIAPSEEVRPLPKGTKEAALPADGFQLVNYRTVTR